MRKLLSVLLLALSLSGVAMAQKNRPADLQPIPEPPAAPAGMADDPVAPEVTIKRRGDDKVEELRVNGVLRRVRITPPNGVPYELVDVKGDGVFVMQEATGQPLSVPQWTVHSW